jgi:hypothetical protein
MRRRLPLGCLAVGLLALLAACGSGGGGGMTTEEWATIGAYQREVATTRQEVAALDTRVAALLTAVPTPEPATPAALFAETWSVAVTGIGHAFSDPNPATSVADPPELEARGAFLAVRLAVSHDGAEPVPRFPWWSLRLNDGAGHTFTPQEEATVAYVTSQGVRRPAAYQPVLVYDEAVVFDVPKELVGQFTLRSADGSLSLPLPPSGLPTPQPCDGDDCV